MFGESESESPRVPSPWDSLISTPPSESPAPSSKAHSPSPLAIELLPRLVAESDDGNVEYKLQLLNPSPARFARLVTQMKWRLLEGGGQAYYELGVADSGDLVGLPREELEQSLETLEMMAGEIGASVIVVKEIEVPAVLATLVHSRKAKGIGKDGSSGLFASSDGYNTPSTSTDTEIDTETEADSLSGTDTEDVEDMSSTVILKKPTNDESSSTPMFQMDSESEDNTIGDDERLARSSVLVGLEISSVYKPLAMKARIHNHPHHSHLAGGKNKRAKKPKHFDPAAKLKKGSHPQQLEEGEKVDKALQRRNGRDRRTEEKKKMLEVRATAGLENDRQNTLTSAREEADSLVHGLESLHVEVVEEPLPVHSEEVTDPDLEELGDDSDVFGSPKPDLFSFPTFMPGTGESHLDVDAALFAEAIDVSDKAGHSEKRLIVEALVVRKLSLEEAFLDFGGFSLI